MGSDDRRRGRGRPPLPQPTLTEPKTTPWGPGQREEFVAVLANMILTHYYEQWRAERGLPQTREVASDPPPGEDAGQSPAS